MNYYVEIVCKDEHTYKLLKDYLKDEDYELVTYLNFNKIIVICEDFQMASRVWDKVARVEDMYSDLKIQEMEIKDLV